MFTIHISNVRHSKLGGPQKKIPPKNKRLHRLKRSLYAI